MKHTLTTVIRSRCSQYVFFGVAALLLLFGLPTVTAQCYYEGGPVTIDFSSETTADYPAEFTTGGLTFSGGMEDMILVVNDAVNAYIYLADLPAEQGLLIQRTDGCRFEAGSIDIENTNPLFSEVVITLKVDGSAYAPIIRNLEPGIASINLGSVEVDEIQLTFTTDPAVAFLIHGIAYTGIPDETPPAVIINNTLTLDEGATRAVDTQHLSAEDDRAEGTDLTFTVTTPPANGQLELVTVPNVSITDFTQNDLELARVIYRHDDSNTLADSLMFTLSDGTNDVIDQKFMISVNPIDDDPPTIVNNNELLVPEEHYTVAIDTTLLKATDTEEEDAGLLYAVTTPPLNGQLENSDNAGIAISAFSQQDLIDGKIGYHHTVDNSIADSLVFAVSDSNTNILPDQVFRIEIAVHPKVTRFSASPLTGAPGTEVQFQNHCGARVNRFLWDFGDGQQLLAGHSVMGSEKMNTTHVYTETGTYTVTLITWGWEGAAPETLIVRDMITITEDAAALSIVDSSETHLNYGWNRAIDDDIVSTNGKITADLPDVTCTFMFTDSVKRVVDNVRLFIDDVEKRNYPGHLTRKFEVWTSVDQTTWTAALAGEIRNRGVFETFSFEPSVCRYVKLKLVEPRNPGAQIIQLTEFQVFGTPVQEIALAKGLVTENGPVQEFALEQNYPNPFNPTTQIALAVPQDCHVKVQVYNTVGQKVGELVNGQLAAGRYNLNFDAHQLPGGVYFYRIEAGSYRAVRRMILLK